MFWTHEKEKLLEKYLLEGNSYGVVGTMIGCSRNAAIGKAKRLGIVVKTTKRTVIPHPVRTRTYVRRRPYKKPVPKPIVVPKVEAKSKKRFRVRLPEDIITDEDFARYMKLPKESNLERLIDIPGQFQCHWIDGDVKGGTGVWCRKTTDGMPWCKDHFKMVYIAGTAFSNRKLKRKV